ncbi:MAG TPA: glycosyltransferase family 4 protein [Solirubrobacteraceae bacterium]|nr:glycosyltransferase family 4 protein [Solirubrobacteraceae bacterium]
MRVLLLHNRYRAEGGEERAVGELHALLERRGHDVVLLERTSDGVGRGRAAASLLRGGSDPAQVAEAVRRLQAEIVHAHNVHPLFGWRALAAAREAGARTVLQLHNFRLFCAIGVAYRDGAVCHECRGANTLPGLRHRCRGSAGEAAVYALALHRQQPELYGHVDRFAVLSDAHGARLRELGLPPDRVETLPNFVSGFAGESRAHLGGYALVAGRLVEEKGFDTAIRAAAAAGVPLVVAGQGPDEPRLRALAGAAEVHFAGWLPAPELAELRAGAGVVLVPSRCEEACPYAVLEALAAGVPVLASDLGGLPELVGAGLPPDDVGAWGAALGALWHDGGRRRELGTRALADARARFGEDVYHDRLLALYLSV